MAGETYTNGIVLTAGFGRDGVVLANLRGKNKIIRYTVGHVDGSRMEKKLLHIYLDGKFYKEYESELSPESGPVNKEIKVAGVHIVKFLLKDIPSTPDAEFGLMNMTVE